MADPTVEMIQLGPIVIDHTAASALVEGDVVVQTDLVGVVGAAAAIGGLTSLHVSGVGRFPKPTGANTDAAAGTLFYWDVADTNAQEDADTGTNKLIGKSVQAVTTTDTHVLIYISQ
ncbi:MAG: DUF2190 family protein [Planctomycetota bacterium]